MKRSTRVPNRPRGFIFGTKFTFPVVVDVESKRRELRPIPVQARVVNVIVSEPTDEKHWAKGLGGTTRKAVMVYIKIQRVDEIFFLDNEDGMTPVKLTAGEGHPSQGLRQLPVERLAGDQSDIARSYRVEYSGIGWEKVGGIELRKPQFKLKAA